MIKKNTVMISVSENGQEGIRNQNWFHCIKNVEY